MGRSREALSWMCQITRCSSDKGKCCKFREGWDHFRLYPVKPPGTILDLFWGIKWTEKGKSQLCGRGLQWHRSIFSFMGHCVPRFDGQSRQLWAGLWGALDSVWYASLWGHLSETSLHSNLGHPGALPLLFSKYIGTCYNISHNNKAIVSKSVWKLMEEIASGY